MIEVTVKSLTELRDVIDSLIKREVEDKAVSEKLYDDYIHSLFALARASSASVPCGLDAFEKYLSESDMPRKRSFFMTFRAETDEAVGELFELSAEFTACQQKETEKKPAKRKKKKTE